MPTFSMKPFGLILHESYFLGIKVFAMECMLRHILLRYTQKLPLCRYISPLSKTLCNCLNSDMDTQVRENIP